ncbi:MAG: hypothetical protein HYX51_10875 [Chloroflexi bacterium]|nr:hypothetical protein [Chloroflexota bacterium]
MRLSRIRRCAIADERTVALRRTERYQPGSARPLDATTFTITSLLGGPPAGYSSTHGRQTSRLFRDGVVSTREAPKCAPARFNSSGRRTYDAYMFQNPAGGPACATVTISVDRRPAAVNVVAYLGRFDPDDIQAGYLADTGHSPSSGPVSFSFTVPGGATVVVVVSANDAAGPHPAYKLVVEGLAAPRPRLLARATDATPTSPARTNARPTGVFVAPTAGSPPAETSNGPGWPRRAR